MKVEHTECSETSAHKIQAPGNHQKKTAPCNTLLVKYFIACMNDLFAGVQLLYLWSWKWLRL